MGRIQRALTAMVAAIPAGFLAFLLVKTFLDSADKLTMTVQIVIGVTLACAALVVLMPFGLLVFGGRKAGDSAAPSKGKSTGDAESIDDDVETIDDDDEFGDVDDVDEADDIDEVDETIGFEDSDADIMSDSNDEIESGGSSLDEIESVDFDDEDDEPAPKKRKK